MLVRGRGAAVVVTTFCVVLSSCTSQAQKEEDTRNLQLYMDCVTTYARILDDRISPAGDIAAAAIYSCSSEERAYNRYGGTLGADVSRIIRERAYAHAVRAVTLNRQRSSAQ